MKNLHLVLVLFSIASMFTSFGVYDVDATKEDNKGKSMSCYNNGNAKNNPHCNATPSSCDTSTDADCDGIPDVEDWCPGNDIGSGTQTAEDWDGDGIPNDSDSNVCVPA